MTYSVSQIRTLANKSGLDHEDLLDLCESVVQAPVVRLEELTPSELSDVADRLLSDA